MTDIPVKPSPLKGWRTVAINVGMAIGVAGLGTLQGVDWSKLGLPTLVAMFAPYVVNLALRAITTTAIGKAQ